MILGSETTLKLQQFLVGAVEPADLGAWISSIEGSEVLLDSDQSVLDELQLLLVEYGEELRPLSEVRGAAATALVMGGSADISSDSNESQAFTVDVSLEAAPG